MRRESHANGWLRQRNKGAADAEQCQNEGGVFAQLRTQNYQGGQEQDPDVADLISRLRTLTPQQSRVLGMLGEGLLNKQIAYELGVSEATIKAHMTAILRKLGANNRTQAVLIAGKLAVDPESVVAPYEDDPA